MLQMAFKKWRWGEGEKKFERKSKHLSIYGGKLFIS
jgi:hypothetical protein